MVDQLGYKSSEVPNWNVLRDRELNQSLLDDGYVCCPSLGMIEVTELIKLFRIISPEDPPGLFNSMAWQT